MQYIHIDKKWFFLVTNGNGFYLSSAKEHQYGNIQHKKHITKVMLLSAIAQPCVIPLIGELWERIPRRLQQQ